MTQQQPYESIGRWGQVEIRRYPEHTIAEVVVDGDFDDAGNRGFRPLFGYIQGQIAMTAPVVQTPGDEGHSVAFVMPEGRDLDTLPVPTDSRVHLRTVAEQLAAALKFSGWGNASDLDKRGRRCWRRWRTPRGSRSASCGWRASTRRSSRRSCVTTRSWSTWSHARPAGDRSAAQLPSAWKAS